MSTKTIQILPLNRVEGDLKIKLELKDNVVTDAWSSGTMYRGFENILKGRGPLDGLVITPRICGICTTAHLNAAARALDMIFRAQAPDNGKRVRNITLAAEKIQNDARHAVLLFMCDFAEPYFKDHPLYEEAVKRYKVMHGESAVQTIRETRTLIEIIAILGGQWPHSSFMVPGGVVSAPSAIDIIHCRNVLKNYAKWYEKRILGCGLDRWRAVKSKADLDAWLDEKAAHQNGDLGFFIRFAREAGLDAMGGGHGNFISFGCSEIPERSEANALDCNTAFFAAGVSRLTQTAPFDQEQISEDNAYAWFADDEAARHPFFSLTKPYATGSEDKKYSWAKAPRYDGLPCETGPLAEMIAAGDPLFTDLIRTDGPSVFVRQLARIVRTACLITLTDVWLKEIGAEKEPFFQDYDMPDAGQGFGLTQAPRGALGHWVTLQNQKISHYQIITPSAWNASPRDARGVRGPWEEALVGTEIRDMSNPLEAGLVVRSFDPCMVCTVHAVRGPDAVRT